MSDKDTVIDRYPYACAELEKSGIWTVWNTNPDGDSGRMLLGLGLTEDEAWKHATETINRMRKQ